MYATNPTMAELAVQQARSWMSQIQQQPWLRQRTATLPPDPRLRLRTGAGPQPTACFDLESGTFRGGMYDGVKAPAGSWSVRPDGTVEVDLGGDVKEILPSCPVTVQIPPTCCVHIRTRTLDGISPQRPAVGKTDCPEVPNYHEVEVSVIGVTPDGKGGMLALFKAPFDPKPLTWPVCSAGGQLTPPEDCCLVTGSDGVQRVQCKDARSRLHGMTAEEAVAAGHTLEVCPPPPKVPPCCIEVDRRAMEMGGRQRGRLVCDDTTHELHGQSVEVTIARDGMQGATTLQVGDVKYVLELPLCVPEDVPEEIPCCVKEGKLYCPEFPEWHGMAYADFQRTHMGGGRRGCFDKAANVVRGGKWDGRQPPAGVLYSPDGSSVTILGLDLGGVTDVTMPLCQPMTLEECPEIPPPPVPPDCCVQETGTSAILVCTDTEHPLHGYEFKAGEFTCFDAPEGRVCEVEVPGSTRQRFRVCPPPPPGPPKCCYDVATGELICPDDPTNQWNGVKLPLIDMVSKGGQTVAVLRHPTDPNQTVTFPLCEEETPPECCFRPSADARMMKGSVGTLVCPTAPSLDGLDATLVDLNVLSDGSVVATVSWPGGGGKMPICCPPPEDCPGCPPPYFCCVNLDTRRFVCPANTAKHGQPADIVSVEAFEGMPFARLSDGSLVPGCGSQCPPPETCPPCELIPPPGDKCCPPGIVPPWDGSPGKPPGLVPPVGGDCPPGGPVPPWNGTPHTVPGLVPPVGGGECPPGGPVPPWNGTPRTVPGLVPPVGGGDCPPGGPVPPWNGTPRVMPGLVPPTCGGGCPPEGPVPPWNGTPGTAPGLVPPVGGVCPPGGVPPVWNGASRVPAGWAPPSNPADAPPVACCPPTGPVPPWNGTPHTVPGLVPPVNGMCPPGGPVPMIGAPPTGMPGLVPPVNGMCPPGAPNGAGRMPNVLPTFNAPYRMHPGLVPPIGNPVPPWNGTHGLPPGLVPNPVPPWDGTVALPPGLVPPTGA